MPSPDEIGKTDKKTAGRNKHESDDPHDAVPYATRAEVDALHARINQSDAERKTDASYRLRNLVVAVAATACAAGAVIVSAGQSCVFSRQLTDFEQVEGAQLTMSLKWNDDRTGLVFLVPNTGRLPATHFTMSGQIQAHRLIASADGHVDLGPQLGRTQPFSFGGDETPVPPDPDHVLYTILANLPPQIMDDIDSRKAMITVGATMLYDNGFGEMQKRENCWNYTAHIWNPCPVRNTKPK